MKKKSITREMAEEGLFLAGSSAAMSAMPSNEVSPYYSQGLSSYSRFYPIRGNLAGAEMLVKGTGKLGKSLKKLK